MKINQWQVIKENHEGYDVYTLVCPMKNPQTGETIIEEYYTGALSIDDLEERLGCLLKAVKEYKNKI